MAIGTQSGYDSGWSGYTTPALERNKLPLTPTIVYGKTGTTIYNKKPYFSISVGTEPNGQTQTLQVSVDNGEFSNLAVLSTQGTTYKYQHDTNLAVGPHTFTFRVADSLGALSLTISTNITVATATFTDSVLVGTPVKAQHINELRAKIDNIR